MSLWISESLSPLRDSPRPQEERNIRAIPFPSIDCFLTRTLQEYTDRRTVGAQEREGIISKHTDVVAHLKGGD